MKKLLPLLCVLALVLSACGDSDDSKKPPPPPEPPALEESDDELDLEIDNAKAELDLVE